MSFPFVTSEPEPDYYKYRVSVWAALKVFQRISRKCLELKASIQLATVNKNFDNCAWKLQKINFKTCHWKTYFDLF